MRYPTVIQTVLAIVASTSALGGESAYERELKQLTDQRDKAAAAAVDPINRRYQASLDQLLKRATQANALDDAIKIRAAIASLSTPASAPGAPTTKATIHALQRKLSGTEWNGDKKSWFGKFSFEGTNLKFTASTGTPTGTVVYRIADDGTIRFTPSNGSEETLIVADDFTTIKNGSSIFTRK